MSDSADRDESTPTSHRAGYRVSVVGGGASGVLTAINLLAADHEHRLRVTVHETTGIVGRGIAYGTSDPRHLLNVRARHMSAFPDVPSDLLDWASRTGRDVHPQGFLPRRDYAAYLQDTLAAVADHRLTVRAGRVEDLEERAGGGFAVHAPGGPGESCDADAVVLALGNQRPRPLTVDGDELPAAPWHVADPWDLSRLHRLRPDATVVVVGSGLTAVDAVVTLLTDHPRRRVVMVSRTGLLPRTHVAQLSTAWVSPVPTGRLTADGLAALVRDQVAAAAAQGVDWRAVVDGLRAPTQDLWSRLDLTERTRFLATYAREWDVHRHRMAPEVAQALAGFEAEGRLVRLTGRLSAVADRGERCTVRVRHDAGTGSTTTEGEPLVADAVLNCTGPLTDVTRSDDPLLLALRERNLAAPDPLYLGLACTTDGRLVDPGGRTRPELLVVGPGRKGVLWESTAIPEIRAQAAEVARALVARAGRTVAAGRCLPYAPGATGAGAARR